MRIEQLEERLGGSGAQPAAAAHHGLPLGEPAVPFTLEGFFGESVTLASLTASPRSLQARASAPSAKA